jgi:hypothetical protein
VHLHQSAQHTWLQLSVCLSSIVCSFCISSCPQLVSVGTEREKAPYTWAFPNGQHSPWALRSELHGFGQVAASLSFNFPMRLKVTFPTLPPQNIALPFTFSFFYSYVHPMFGSFVFVYPYCCLFSHLSFSQQILICQDLYRRSLHMTVDEEAELRKPGHLGKS